MEIEKRKSICDIFYSRTDGLGQWISYEGSYKAEISDDIFFFYLKDHDVIYWDEEATNGRNIKTSLSVKQVMPCIKSDWSWQTFKTLLL